MIYKNEKEYKNLTELLLVNYSLLIYFKSVMAAVSFFKYIFGVSILQNQKIIKFSIFTPIFLQDVTENRSRYQTTTSFTSGAIRYWDTAHQVHSIFLTCVDVLLGDS